MIKKYLSEKIIGILILSFLWLSNANADLKWFKKWKNKL